MIIFTLALLTFLTTIALAATIKAIAEKDLVKAVVFSALQSVAYAIIYGVLMAPDILYAYIAVGIGIYPVIVLYAIAKTYRFEGGRK